MRPLKNCMDNSIILLRFEGTIFILIKPERDQKNI